MHRASTLDPPLFDHIILKGFDRGKFVGIFYILHIFWLEFALDTEILILEEANNVCRSSIHFCVKTQIKVSLNRDFKANSFPD